MELSLAEEGNGRVVDINAPVLYKWLIIRKKGVAEKKKIFIIGSTLCLIHEIANRTRELRNFLQDDVIIL